MMKWQSMSRRAWVSFVILDICAVVTIGVGVSMLLGDEWYYSIPLAATGIGMLWYNTP